MGNKRANKGLTLVELLIGIAIFVIVAGIAGTFLVQGFVLLGNQLDHSIDETNIRNVMMRMVDEMRSVTSDKITVGTNTLTIDGNTYQKIGDGLYYKGKVLFSGIDSFTVTESGGEISIAIKTKKWKNLETAFAKKG